jgi:hypothetical protein
MKCERCGEVNPAEIHTCTPTYVDRRQWKYDPMTGKKLWQGLTDEEREEAIGWSVEHIEAKLKEKNG